MKKMITLLIVATIALSHINSAESAEPSRMLFVTQSKGFVHGSVKRQKSLAPAEIAITQLGEQTGLFRVDCTQDCEADLTKENLKNYDIVAFYTSGDLPISDANTDYFFNNWLKKKGHGVLGFHSAADTYREKEIYWDMIGGTFIKHPWGSGTKVTLTNHYPDNPLTAPFGQNYTQQEEIYMYRHWQPEKVRVLLSLDYSQSPTGVSVNTQFGYHVPVCWIKEYGQGRIYYNNLGHREDTWTKKQYMDSITQAVKWIRGEIEIDATPNPDLSAAQEKKAQADFAAGNFTKE